jgi:hypothetical protein
VSRTYDVELVEPYGRKLVEPYGKISGAGKYESPDGELPNVGDVIPVDDQGRHARVTHVWPDDHPPIRALLLAE